jgi:hypothetical protein
LEDERIFKRELEEGISLSYQQEILKLTKDVVNACFSALENGDAFTMELLEEENPRAHGDYNTATAHIRIYNAINKSREHLVATALHEAAHHIEFVMHKNTGHSKRFYKLLFELLEKGVEMEYIDYEEAKAKKALDSADLKQMERYFGSPEKKA